MRSKIVAGNWKMNLTFDEAETLVDDILDRLDEQDEMNCEVIICPPFPYLEMLTDYEFDEQRFNVGAQNCSAYDKGAYTGEVSAKMLKSIDVDYCIIGHSERRKYFGETNEVLAEKINRLIENNMSPIYCVGEVLEEREAGRHFEVVKEQLEKGLFHLDGDAIYDAIIASGRSNFIIASIFALLFLGFEIYNYRHLPVIDFMNWKVGKQMNVQVIMILMYV